MGYYSGSLWIIFLYSVDNKLRIHSYLILVFILIIIIMLFRQDPCDNSALVLKGYPVL